MKRKNIKDINIVAIGGGTGLSTLLKGLKKYTENISAIVTVSDDGGSSGRLSRKYGILPPGDIRNCLVSLAEQESLMSKLFQYRFSGKGDISGHNFGNLFITAMSHVFGSFERGIIESSKILAIKGSVVPATLKKIVLGAELDNSNKIFGETNISKVKNNKIKKLFLIPSYCKAFTGAILAIKNADLIIMGPGSIYTSILPNLLIKDISKAIKSSRAKKVFICNIMSQPGETDGFSAEEHLKVILDHLKYKIVDFMVINTAPIPKNVFNHYKKHNSYPVVFDNKNEFMNIKKIFANVCGNETDTKYARHDSEKIADVIIKGVL